MNKVIIYKGTISEIIEEMKKEIENKDLVGTLQQRKED